MLTRSTIYIIYIHTVLPQDVWDKQWRRDSAGNTQLMVFLSCVICIRIWIEWSYTKWCQLVTAPTHLQDNSFMRRKRQRRAAEEHEVWISCRHYCSCQWLQLDRWNDNFDHAITSSLDTDDAWRCMTMQWCSSDNSALSGLIHLRRLWWWMRLLGEVPRRIAPWAQSIALRL